MKKIGTLFKKNPDNLALVTNEVDPQYQWVIDGDFIATRKFDGAACAVVNGNLYKRYDAKHGKPAPVGGIPCQDPDPVSGHWPHWIKCERDNPADKYFWEGYDHHKLKHEFNELVETFECCGPKINGNPEKYMMHVLVKHGAYRFYIGGTIDYDGLKIFMGLNDCEGIVFYHKSGDGRMCKLRQSDFGLKRKR